MRHEMLFLIIILNIGEGAGRQEVLRSEQSFWKALGLHGSKHFKTITQKHFSDSPSPPARSKPHGQLSLFLTESQSPGCAPWPHPALAPWFAFGFPSLWCLTLHPSTELRCGPCSWSPPCPDRPRQDDPPRPALTCDHRPQLLRLEHQPSK